MNAIELRGISKKYGRLAVLQDLNLTVESGSFTVVFGSPACGKSVLVRLITGLEKPNEGGIFLRGNDATNVDTGERNIGYVPQSFALYPHYSIYDNIAYPLNLTKAPKSRVHTAVMEIAAQLKIDHLLEKLPNQLSGGEKQRVALARGVIKHTDIYILDDPLVGLDFKLREQMFDDLKEMQENLGATFVYTTSDPLETLALSDNAAILEGGRIVEVGTLGDLYENPQHETTMGLLGFPKSNRFEGALSEKAEGVVCRSKLFDFPVELANSSGDVRAVDVYIRPEDILIESERKGLLHCSARVVLLDDLGGEVIAYLDVDGTSLVTVVSHDRNHLVSDEKLTIGVRPSKAVLFRQDTGQRIGQGVD